MDGILIINKAAGRTSSGEVLRARRLLNGARTGHAGTLDPMATGILIIGVGRATRILRFAEALDKEYTGLIRLGTTTDTDDAEGKTLLTRPVPLLARGDWERVLRAFTGPLSQIPPQYSAVKQDGVRAYARARRGETVEIKPRAITVFALELLAYDPASGEARVRVHCSRGTYVRALARDIGEALGCGAHLAELRRDRVGSFTLKEAVALTDDAHLARLEKALLPMDSILAALPSVAVDAAAEGRIRLGQTVQTVQPNGDVLVRDRAGRPLCLARVEGSEGRRFLQPERMLA